MYRPRVLPQFLDATLPGVIAFIRQLMLYLQQELQNIANAVVGPVEYRSYQTLHAVPAKYWDGMTVFADGTDWNPGAGQGLYVYYAGAWNKLG